MSFSPRSIRSLIGLMVVLSVAGCGAFRSAPATPTACVHIEVRDLQTARPIEGATVTFEVEEFGPVESFTTPPSGNVNASEPGHQRACQVRQGPKTVRVEAEGYEAYQQPWYVLASAPNQERSLVIPLTPTVPPIEPPRGRVTAQGRAYKDADGPYVAMGATMFWAYWGACESNDTGFKGDRQQTEENLAWLSKHGFTSFRTLLEAWGPGNWAPDRGMNPHRPGSRRCLEWLIDTAYDTYGLRTQITIFGGLDYSRTQVMRRRVIDMVATVIKDGRLHKVEDVELVNEGFQNYHGQSWPSAIRDDYRYLKAQLPAGMLVAPTTAWEHDPGGWSASVRHLYSGLNATLSTIHGPGWRTVNMHPERHWRAVRQYWEMCHGGEFAAIAHPCSANEPIGMGSGVTVGTENSVTRMGAHFASALIAGFGKYVWHSTPGITGGGVNGHGMPSFSDHWASDATAELMARIRERLPPDIANWNRTAQHWSGDRFQGTQSGQDWVGGASTGVSRVFGTARGNRAIYLLLGIKGHMDMRCRRGMKVTVWYPRENEEFAATCNAGGSFRVRGTGDQFDENKSWALVFVEDR